MTDDDTQRSLAGARKDTLDWREQLRALAEGKLQDAGLLFNGDQVDGTAGDVIGVLVDAVAELDAEADRAAEALAGQTMFRGMTVDGDGVKLDLVPPHELVAIMVNTAKAMLGDAPNYTETAVTVEQPASLSMEVKVAGEVERYAFVVQRVGKLTPHQARQQAEAERDEARAEVEQWRATYGETALCDASAKLAELDLLRAAASKFDERLSDVQAEHGKAAASWDRQRDRMTTELAEARAALPVPAPDREALAQIVEDAINDVVAYNQTTEDDEDLRSDAEIAVDALIAAGMVRGQPTVTDDQIDAAAMEMLVCVRENSDSPSHRRAFMESVAREWGLSVGIGQGDEGREEASGGE